MSGEPDLTNLMPNPTPTRWVDTLMRELQIFSRFVGKMHMVKKEMATEEVCKTVCISFSTIGGFFAGYEDKRSRWRSRILSGSERKRSREKT